MRDPVFGCGEWRRFAASSRAGSVIADAHLGGPRSYAGRGRPGRGGAVRRRVGQWTSTTDLDDLPVGTVNALFALAGECGSVARLVVD